MTVDRYTKNDVQFNTLYNMIYNDYCNFYNIQFVENANRYTEIYRKDNHRIICHIFNYDVVEIEIERYYYYYNK